MRIQPFIATLAMMVFARGLAKVVSGGRRSPSTSTAPDGTSRVVDLPRAFDVIDSRILGGNLSVVTVIFLVCVLVTWIVLARLRSGRHVYAVGGNEEAARLSGVPVRRTLVPPTPCRGLRRGGRHLPGRPGEAGRPEAGIGYELDAIAMVVIGGTSLAGGKGSVTLTLIGVLTIGYLEKILSINAVPEATRLMLTGVIIVCAVLFQRGR